MNLDDLDVRLPDGPVHLLNPLNQGFLQGLGEPVLGGSNPLFTWIGWAMIVTFGGLLVLLLGVTVSMLLWHSSLAPTAEAAVQEVVGDQVTYTWTVDGAPMTATERSPRVSLSGRETVEIRYLAPMPSWSKLEVNNEDVDWFTFVGATGLLIGLVIAGRILVRDSQRLRRLAIRASHVLPATLTLEIPGPSGSRNYIYELVTPAGKTVRGSVSVGTAVRFPVPGPVAVLYADDATHTLL